MPTVLVPLAPLVLVLWVLATAAAIAVIMGYIAGALSGLPWPLDKLAGPVASLAHYIEHACGKLEHGIDSLIGGAWHWMARYLDRTWHQIEANAHLAWQQSELLAHEIYRGTGLSSLVHDLAKVWRGIEHGVKQLERLWHGIEARVKALEHALAQGIGHDLHIGLRKIEREWHRFRTKELPRIEADVAAIPKELGDLRKWIADNVPLVGTTALVGAVAWALSRLGLDWLRCNSNPFKNNAKACGLWGDLAGLLAGAALFGLALDFRDIVKAAVELEKEGAQAVSALTILDSAAIADAAQAVADAANAIAT